MFDNLFLKIATDNGIFVYRAVLATLAVHRVQQMMLVSLTHVINSESLWLTPISDYSIIKFAFCVTVCHFVDNFFYSFNMKMLTKT